MRMVDELAELRPPGACDLPRAALLAMRGRFDEAWPLAEARSRHLREISNNSAQDGHCYLWLIATIEGDRERACRHNADMIEILGSGSVAAAFRSFLASDLCYLGRSRRGGVRPSTSPSRSGAGVSSRDGPVSRGAAARSAR